jgi:DNA-binding response OmpR family regulator
LRIADLEMDTYTRRVTRGGREILLNKMGFKILEMLMRAHPGVVNRQALEEAIWGDMPPGSDSLRSHIYALRLKIDKPFELPLIQTIHGVGYRLVVPNETDE